MKHISHILQSAGTLRLCVRYDSHSKQRLLPPTALNFNGDAVRLPWGASWTVIYYSDEIQLCNVCSLGKAWNTCFGRVRGRCRIRRDNRSVVLCCCPLCYGVAEMASSCSNPGPRRLLVTYNIFTATHWPSDPLCLLPLRAVVVAVRSECGFPRSGQCFNTPRPHPCSHSWKTESVFQYHSSRLVTSTSHFQFSQRQRYHRRRSAERVVRNKH